MPTAASDPSAMLTPMLRPALPGSDSGVMALVLGALLLGAVAFPVVMRLWRAFASSLFQAHRRRTGASTELTANERWALLGAMAQTAVMEGLLIFSLLCPPGASLGPLSPLAAAGAIVGAVVAVTAVQAAGYRVVGFTFAPSAEASRDWLRTFALTQALLGYLLLIPALASLFYPAQAPLLAAIGGGLYVLARIVFYIRSFRIFYDGIFSIVYFFLYLCTLEIAPIAAILTARSYLLDTII